MILNLRAAAFSVTLLAAGCVSVPLDQIARYSASVGQLRGAAMQIYDLLAPSLQDGAAAGEVPFPVTLGPADIGAGECAARYPSAPSLKTRCDAFTAAAAYNDALLALAQGAPATRATAQLRGAVGSVAALGGALNPSAGAALSGPAAALLLEVFEDALTIRDRARLRSALLNGAPQVRALYAWMIEDVTRPGSGVYALSRAIYAARLEDIAVDAEETGDDMFGVVGGRARPAGADGKLAFAALQARIDPLLARPEPAPFMSTLTEHMQDGGARLTTADLARLSDLADVLQRRYADFDAAAAKWTPHRAAVETFLGLLISMQTAFDELIAAAENPLSPGGGAVQLADAIAAARDQARRIEDLLD